MSLRGRGPQSTDRQIVWDGLGLDSAHSGIGYYGKCLYDALSELGETPVVTALAGASSIINREKLLIVSDAKALNSKRRLPTAKIYGLKPVFPSLSYKMAARKFSAMIYHGLSNLNLPCFVKRRPSDRFVVTIHDLIPLMAGGPSALAVQMRVLMPRVVQVADAIIVPSNWTKNSLIERFGENITQKINVIPNGTIDFTSEISKDAPREKTNDVLSVARGESYKRLHFITALAKALPAAQFILVTDELGARRVGAAPPNLKVFTKISRRQLLDAYAASRIFLHPSLYEGWCLPAADAIKGGLFTLYVKGTGIEEVCAYAPQSCIGLEAGAGIDSWHEALTDALANKANKSIIGTEITLPTWRENAEKTLKIYHSLI